MKTTQEVIARIRAEFLEMPGMRLTVRQVQRLCGIEQALCQTVLDSLVRDKFLCVKPDGSYGRFTERDVPRVAKSKLSLERRVTTAS